MKERLRGEGGGSDRIISLVVGGCGQDLAIHIENRYIYNNTATQFISVIIRVVSY